MTDQSWSIQNVVWEATPWDQYLLCSFTLSVTIFNYCSVVLSIKLIFLSISNNSKILLPSLLFCLEPIISCKNLWIMAALLFTHFYLLSHCLSTKPYNIFCCGMRGILQLPPPFLFFCCGKGHSPILGIKLQVTTYIPWALFPGLVFSGQIPVLCSFILTGQLSLIIAGKIKYSNQNFPCIN